MTVSFPGPAYPPQNGRQRSRGERREVVESYKSLMASHGRSRVDV
jgi:hypothetical protein